MPAGIHPLGAILRSLHEEDDAQRPVKPQPDAALDTLRERYDALQERHTFHPGQPGTWKRGLVMFRNREWAGLPMLVVDVDPLDLDRYPPRLTNLQMAAERADIVVMFLGSDGNTKLLWCDSRMLRPWHPEEAGG